MRKKPTFLQAVLPLATLLIILVVGYGALSLRVEPLLILSAFIIGIYSIKLGYSWDDIIDNISTRIVKIIPAIFILLAIGMLIGSWISSGTIPMMVYYGLLAIDPKYLAIVAFLVTSFFSICTGTSWGSAGTVGIVFMGLAASQGVSPPMVAGAVVAGAYFGDKLSPLSDSSNVASMLCEVNLYEHIKHMLYTTVPGYIISGIIFSVVSIFSSTEVKSSSESVSHLINDLDNVYSWNILLLLPMLIVLVGALIKKPPLPIILLSTIVAALIGIFYQGFSSINVVEAVVSGFDMTMIKDNSELSSEILSRILNSGGAMSMFGAILLIFSGIAFVGVYSVTGGISVLIEKLIMPIKKTGNFILTSLLSSILMVCITLESKVAQTLLSSLLKDDFISRGLHRKNLSRSLEDTTTMIEPIIPWTVSGAYMAGVLGVSTIDYAPWAILNYTGIIFAIIYGYTGFAIAKVETKRKLDDQQEISV